jgi:EF-P beta-lysylation protein EpmB
MSTAQPLPESRPGWQHALAQAYTRSADLLAALGLDPAQMDVLPDDATRAFAMRVPRAYAQRMRPGDPRDPLLLQVLPRGPEHESVEGFITDPVGDLDAVRVPGVLQKYAGRALVITTGACAVHCRYCFRREFPYAEHHSAAARPADLGAALSAMPDVTEVILSGGDPLSLSDRRIGALLAMLDQQPGVQRIRMHTRLPIVLPERVTGTLMDALGRVGKPVIMVLHCNHAQEIDASVAAAAARLSDACALLLNQSVLLRGINDSVATLVALSEQLFAAGITPYYLHQLDPVRGAAHFAVADDQARTLLAGAARQLPGYLVPRLVREVPGAASKSPL